MIYCMFKMLDGGGLKFEGVASSENIARAAIRDGTYVVCPINMDKRYDEDIASEGFSGAVTVKSVPTEQTEQTLDLLANVETALTSLDNLVRKTMIPQLQPLVSADLPAQITALADRLETLENAT